MAKNPSPLNPKQVLVLDWIKGGCPDKVYVDGYEHRIIARALERRGLVSITGRGPTWTAKATAAGKSWGTQTLPEFLVSGELDADALIDRVLGAEGHLLLPDDREVEKYHERLIRMSLKSSNRPKGKSLEMRSTGRWGSGPKEIIFVEYFDDRVRPLPVPVPKHMGKYHPAVKAFLANKDWQYVTPDYLLRAAHILQAITNEAPKRGLEIVSASEANKANEQYPSQKVPAGHLLLKTSLGIYGIEVREVPGPGAQKLEPRRWDQKKTLPGWRENRGWDFISTGKLELVVNGPGSAYNGDRYRDAKSSSVEDKLPRLFGSFEIHHLRAEWREQERQREEAERQHARDNAVAEAKVRYGEHKRWEHFTGLAHQWREVRRHKEFLEAIRTSIDSPDSIASDELLVELNFAEHKLERTDPLKHLESLIPNVPEPTPEDLKPFLPRWTDFLPNSPLW